MELESLIRNLESHGGVFEIVGERLKLLAKQKPTPEDLTQLKQSRAQVITFLRSRELKPGHSLAEPALLTHSEPRSGSAEMHKTYCRQLRELTRRICKAPYQPGTMAWLQHAYPDIHQQLTSALPTEIDRLCEAQVEPQVLQAVLDRLFETLGQACDVYEERMAIQGEGSGSDSTSRDEEGPL